MLYSHIPFWISIFLISLFVYFFESNLFVFLGLIPMLYNPVLFVVGLTKLQELTLKNSIIIFVIILTIGIVVNLL